MRNHRLPADDFQALCDGRGGPAVIRELVRSQRSRRLLVIDQVFRTAVNDLASMGPLPPATAAWDVLAAAGDIDDLLLHPQIGAWAAYVLRRRRGRVSSAAPEWIDFGVLHAIALVAARRAGLSWRTRLPVRSGRVMLPMLGMADIGTPDPWSTVEATCDAGVIRLAGVALEQDPRWLPLRRLTSGSTPRLTVFLDDVDPFRDLAEPVGPARLTGDEVGRWQQLLDDAWDLLCRHHPGDAAAIAAGVRSLVPLPGGGGETRSASSGEAFGSVLVSPPVDGVDLAVALVHEFQHTKLGGLIHLGALTTGDDTTLYYAPWRDDPRPLGGLLQGIYAFTGVAAFWREQRRVAEPGDRPAADFEYAYARDQVARGLHEVTRSGGLTAWGGAVTGALTDRLRSWQGDVVAPGPARSAALLTAIHRAGWRLRHLVPDDGLVRALADAWLRAAPPAVGGYRPRVRASSPVRWSLGWQGLLRRRVAGRAPLITAPLRRAGITDADVALAGGDVGAAAAAYRTRVAGPAGGDDAWTGLTVSLRSVPAMHRVPELVRAVHDELSRRGAPAEPVEIARWLGVSDLRPVLPDHRLDAPEAG